MKATKNLGMPFDQRMSMIDKTPLLPNQLAHKKTVSPMIKRTKKQMTLTISTPYCELQMYSWR